MFPLLNVTKDLTRSFVAALVPGPPFRLAGAGRMRGQIPRKTPQPLKYLFLPILASAFLLIIACPIVLSQGTQGEEKEVIQTEIDFDQMTQEGPSRVSQHPPKESASEGKTAVFLEDESLAVINQSLRNAIEENKKLSQQNKTMEEELKRMRGASEVHTSRINFLTSQRDDLEKRMEEKEKSNQEYLAQLEESKAAMGEKEKEFEVRLRETEHQEIQKREDEEKAIAEILPQLRDEKYALTSQKEWQDLKKEARETLQDLEGNTKKIAQKMSQLDSENKKLKADSAKLHYNLANTFFEQGRYERAAKEYKKVVEFMPYDAEAHYNLAFVSGEFLGDQKTALEHYQQYLYLNPYADDLALVKEKILEIQLNLKTTIDSPLDRPLKWGEN